MLKYRILTALILIPILIACVVALSPISFCVLTALIVLWGAWEWSAFLKIPKKSLRFLYVIVTGSLLILCFELPVLPVLYIAFAWWLIAIPLVTLYPKGSKGWGKNQFVLALMGFLVLIPCWVAINYIRNANDGIFILLYVFVLIWGADSGAYFVGRKWGQHKLAPSVSPGKTWEGLLGALITALTFCFIVLYFSKTQYSVWLFAILLSIVTVLFSVLGDLFESMLKRNVGVKDSGSLLPGHGGLLDRIDSLTAAAPIFAIGATLIGNYFQ